MIAERQRRRIVPRTKYTKPPGPLPAIEQIQRSNFRFRHSQWRELTKLLPSKLADLGVPPDAVASLPKKVKTMADWVVQETENAINSYLTTSPLSSTSPINRANVRAAIRGLRKALKLFVLGWVDSETTDLIPGDLDTKLAARDEEIARMRLPSAQQRALAKLCQFIEVFVRQFVSANGERISEEDTLRYVDASVTFARIKHPSITKHRDRLAALVFPKNTRPHSALKISLHMGRGFAHPARRFVVMHGGS
jgi:hypothetical protein